LRNREGTVYAFTSALATLGGGAFLAWIPAWVKDADPPRAARTVVVEPSFAWWCAGAVAALFGALVLGPGVSLG
jgi:hypothetical protein